MSNRYKILKQIGEGGFGKVYLIEDPLTKHLFCLKELISNDSLVKEIQLILNHNFDSSFLVKYHSHFSEMGKTYILMEYCEKGSLADWIEKQTSYPPENLVLQMFAQIVEGVSTLHINNFIHRDIKPSNVLITRNGELKLADFGTLKNIAGDKGGSTTFTTGTIGFFPKEEIEGHKPTTASDVFALGCTIYNVMNLARPFNAPTVFGIPQLVLEGKYSPLSGPYTSSLKELVYSMMNKDLSARPSLPTIRVHPLLASTLTHLPPRLALPAAPSISLLSRSDSPSTTEASSVTAPRCAVCHASAAAPAHTVERAHIGWCMSSCTCSRGHIVCASCLLGAARMAVKLKSRGVVACPVEACEEGTFSLADVGQRIPGDMYARLYGTGEGRGYLPASQSSLSSSPSPSQSSLPSSSSSSFSSSSYPPLSSFSSSSTSSYPSSSSSSSSPSYSCFPSSSSSSSSSSSFSPLLENDQVAVSANLSTCLSAWTMSLLIYALQQESKQQFKNPAFSALLTRLSLPPKPYFYTGVFIEAFRIAVKQDKCFLALVNAEDAFLRHVLCTPTVAEAIGRLKMNVWGFAFHDSYNYTRALRRIVPGVFLLGSLSGKITVINMWQLPVGNTNARQLNSVDFLKQLMNSVADYESRREAFIAVGGNPRLFAGFQ